MKGVLMAGGRGTRLRPVTKSVNKHLLPVYDKPLFYYPLSLLMLSGVREVLIICDRQHQPQFFAALGDGSHLGLKIHYKEQSEPRGIAEGLILAEDFLGGDDVVLVLGDNVLHGTGLYALLQDSVASLEGCTVFGQKVGDPSRFGIASIDLDGQVLSIEEKPANPKTSLAVTGLYLFENEAVEAAKAVHPSARGELEITTVVAHFAAQRRAQLIELSRGYAWLDAGTSQSLLEASQYVSAIETRQGVKIACLEEIALRLGYISQDDCLNLAAAEGKSEYANYLRDIFEIPKI